MHDGVGGMGTPVGGIPMLNHRYKDMFSYSCRPHRRALFALADCLA